MRNALWCWFHPFQASDEINRLETLRHWYRRRLKEEAEKVDRLYLLGCKIQGVLDDYPPTT